MVPPGGVKPGVMFSNEFDRWLRTEVSVSGVGTVGGDSGRVLPEDLYARGSDGDRSASRRMVGRSPW
jgi:hypothetical protein